MSITESSCENWMFGSVAVAVDYKTLHGVVVSTPGYDAADWQICLADLNYRFGDIGAVGAPEWDETQGGAWVHEIDLTGSPSARRLSALAALGALGESVRYSFPTADVTASAGTGKVCIATDPDVEQEDWKAVCGILRGLGLGDYDIGEPAYDHVSHVWVWEVPIPGGI